MREVGQDSLCRRHSMVSTEANEAVLGRLTRALSRHQHLQRRQLDRPRLQVAQYAACTAADPRVLKLNCWSTHTNWTLSSPTHKCHPHFPFLAGNSNVLVIIKCVHAQYVFNTSEIRFPASGFWGLGSILNKELMGGFAPVLS